MTDDDVPESSVTPGAETAADADLPECPGCGSPVWGPMARNRPMHNGDGLYYMAGCCPKCDHVLVRFVPEGDARLRADLRERAKLDPDPDAVTEGDDAAE